MIVLGTPQVLFIMVAYYEVLGVKSLENKYG
jgi:hypothetical protein